MNTKRFLNPIGATLHQTKRLLGFHTSSASGPSKHYDHGLFEVDNWAVSDFIATRLIPIVGVHPFPLTEQQLLVAATCWYQPTHIFEWGTHFGKSARIFYETCQEYHLQTVIHSIDLPNKNDHNEHPGEQLGVLVKGLDAVRLHLGDGLDTSLKIAQPLPPEARLLFFLDGDHRYDSVKRELGRIVQVFPHAAVLLHDTFYQKPVSGYNVGPYKALREILDAMPERYCEVAMSTGLPGITFVYPTP